MRGEKKSKAYIIISTYDVNTKHNNYFSLRLFTFFFPFLDGQLFVHPPVFTFIAGSFCFGFVEA